jgi:glutamate dehydrogenase/leucine dehydrogenase
VAAVDVTAAMSQRGHEQVVLVADHAAGLRAVIAIHSTALGPSLGGVRFWRYDTEEAAIRDVLALSEAMTWKASIAGLDQGGGKAVVLVDDPDQPRSEAQLRALGRAIDELGGRYLAAEDVGATTRDMDGLATVTPWVTGVSEAHGGSGDPSPVTAWGVLHAMRAALAALDGLDAPLEERRVAIQGAGKVGTHLAALARDAGMRVTVADVNEERARAVAARVDGDVTAADDILAVDCDVLAPCALGGVLDAARVPRLACRVVCGAANNQLADPGVADLLADRRLLYIPDFLASGGGIINLSADFTGYERARAMDRAASIGATTSRVLERAARDGETPYRVAMAMARERVQAAGARRWRPGDPAAWTNGKPLRQLRPAGTVH